MNVSLKLLSTQISGIIALGFLVGASGPAHALTWNDAGVSDTWSIGLGDPNWLPGNVDWINGGTATFVGAGEAVEVGSNLEIGALDFVGAGSYTLNNTSGYTVDFTGTGISAAGSGPQLITSNGVINFMNASTAGNSSLTVSNSGNLHFQGTSTAGSASLSINTGPLFFEDASTAGASSIDNQGIVEFSGTASGGTATVANGGTLDLSLSALSTLTLGSLSNASGGFSGAVILGDNQLAVANGLTLGASPGNLLDFTLFTPGTSGAIQLTGGSFTGAGLGEVSINITEGAAALTGTYDLIDWTGFPAIGVQLGDFVLTLPPAYAGSGYTLQINGSKLQLAPAASSLAEDGIIWHQPLARSGMSHDTDPSAGGTLKYRFKKGSTLPIKIHVLGSLGNDVTNNSNISGKVAVFGDTNCDGAADTLELTISFHGVGEAGGVMDKIGGHLKYNLDTKKLPSISPTNCYILQVTVTDSSTGDTLVETVPLQAK